MDEINIEIQEDIKISGTNIILEKGDRIQVIQEKLIPFSMERLNREIKNRPELYDLLMTPVEKLPDKYKYLVTPGEKGKLYDIISYANKTPYAYYSAFFSESTTNELVGWVGYFEDLTRTMILSLETFAFQLDPLVNMRLAADLMKLIKDLLETHLSVNFIAFSKNPANKVYRKACEKFKREGYNVSIIQKANEVSYSIQSKDVKNITKEVLKEKKNK